jgi:hypothetical protein
MSRVLRKATMFCRSTHLKDKPALTNGDTIMRVIEGVRLQSGVKSCLVIDCDCRCDEGFYTNELNQTVTPLKTENRHNY